MDIYNAAIKYKKLLKTKYIFTVAHKKSVFKIVVSFPVHSFFHLAGLHKLTDLDFISNRKSTLLYFNNILNKNITTEMLSASSHFNEIVPRINIVENLDTIVENENLIFKINKNATHIKIKAQFLIESEFNNNVVELFLSEKDNEYFCISTYITSDEAKKGFIKQTILRKEKIENNDTIILYKR